MFNGSQLDSERHSTEAMLETVFEAQTPRQYDTSVLFRCSKCSETNIRTMVERRQSLPEGIVLIVILGEKKEGVPSGRKSRLRKSRLKSYVAISG